MPAQERGPIRQMDVLSGLIMNDATCRKKGQSHTYPLLTVNNQLCC